MSKLDFTRTPEFPELETQVQAQWESDDTFQRSVSDRPQTKSYVFYDGPPFATGMPHYGHLLASTTKDVVPRYWTMKGYRVERVWGWDCHGLPIEHMIEKQLGIKGGKKGIEALGIDKFNQACRTEVLRLDKEWERIIGRLGRWVDFAHNYKTMDVTFMESVWWGFSQLYKKGLVYEGRKVILYCPRCATPLSNFEIAMDNSYQDINEESTTYKYPVVGQENTYLLAWSTTPWNKLATPALAVHPDLTYIQVKVGNEHLILVESRLKEVVKEEYEVEKTLTGKQLAELTFTPHFDFYPQREKGEKFGAVVADEFVTAEEGTGIVTLAIYGEDDYRVMQANHIQLIEHVDDEGRLKPEVTPWAGMNILEANPLIDAALEERGLIYSHTPHQHSVPGCYRCATRLYYAPLPAWFIDVSKLKSELIAQNEKVNWYPNHLKHGRFLKGLEGAPDWNISRSRYWGTPMPIWRSESGEMRVIGSLAELKEWAVDPARAAKVTDLHREFLDDIEVWVDEARTLKGQRISEVFDCWVESGSMPFAAIHYPFEHQKEFEANYPAQFVSEYIAQTRAWFYTMHVMSVGLFGTPSFEHVLTTGTILAEDGTKMSKSKKNYPDPMLIIDKYGADSLRLYLMASPVMKGENLNFTEKDVADIRRNVFVIWWNVLSFYFQAGAVKEIEKAPTPKHVMDQWLMALLAKLVKEVTASLDNYDVVKASRLLMGFVQQLSTWYVRLSRERLRSSEESRQVLGHVLYRLSQLFAPLCPFFAESSYQAVRQTDESVHLSAWPEVAAYETHQNEQLLTEMETVGNIVEQGHRVRKEAQLKVRQPLAKAVVTSAQDLQLSPALQELLCQELNLKTVECVVKAESELTVTLDTTLTPELKAEGQARELMRSIQNVRKEAKLAVQDHATVSAPEWPSEWQERIEQKTNTTLVKGEALAILNS
jgi:isoleucyl-tRNA synthetase